MKYLLWASVIGAFSLDAAWAAETPVKHLDLNELCTTKSGGKAYIEPNELREQLWDNAPNRRSADISKEGTYALDEITNHLILQSGVLADFVSDEDAVFRFHWKDKAYAQAVIDKQMRYVLDPKGRYVAVECVGFDQSDEDEVAEDDKKKKLVGQFRLRSDIKNLTIEMTEGTVQAELLLPAMASFSEDMLSDESVFQAQAFAGLALTNEDEDFTFIPFVGLNRRFSDQSVEKRIDNASGGFLFAGILGDGPRWRQEIAAQLTYTTDTLARTEIASAKLFWSPYLDDLFGVWHPVGEGPAEIYFRVDGQGHFGEVFDDGGKESLSDSDEYARVGAQLYVGLRGAEYSFIEDLEAHISYLYLYGISGQYDEIERFEAALNYMFGGELKNFGVGLKYTKGRVDETLEKADFLEGNFLIRF